jgi:hypothetical protein
MLNKYGLLKRPTTLLLFFSCSCRWVEKRNEIVGLGNEVGMNGIDGQYYFHYIDFDLTYLFIHLYLLSIMYT